MTTTEIKQDLKIIYDRECDRIYRIAMVYLRTVCDAEDAVQAVFVKLLEKPQCFEDEEHEKAWFILVTKNYCRDILRSSWRKRIDLGDIPERASEDAMESDVLIHMMKLPVKYREVLYLYYYEGYSVGEMSKMLDRKESTIQTQLATARKKLKIELEKEGFIYAGK